MEFFGQMATIECYGTHSPLVTKTQVVFSMKVSYFLDMNGCLVIGLIKCKDQEC